MSLMAMTLTATSPADLIPAPRAVDGPYRTPFVLGTGTALAAATGTEGVARWLRTTLGSALGRELPPGVAGAAHTITLRIDPSLEPEAYRLSVASGVEIVGGTAAGVFWGAQTLRQLLGPDAYRRACVDPEAWRGIAHQVIEDAPRFPWRGLMLDVSRHFLPKDDVLRYLDLLAAHKLNVFHFHLTDDQGWRIEIKRYPKLTDIGAWRTRTKYGHRASELWDERPHGGYYTQDDIREIVAYAAERHISVVPEIDIPGHSQAAIAAYPELGNTDVIDTTTLSVWDNWGINPNVLAPTDNTLRFYEGGCEELLEGGSRAKGRAPVERDEEEGARAALDLRLTPRGRPLDEERRQGVRAPGGETTELGLAPGAAVSSWRGYAGGIAAAEAGHDVVMCPQQHVYLDHRQHGGAQEPMPIGYVRTLEDVYRFEPVPPALSPEAAAHILGTQANVWTEVMQDRSRVDYQVFPRLAAFAEVAWSALPAPAERDFADFERRMTAHYKRLDALGVDYRPPGGPLPWQKRPGVIGRPIEGAPPNV